MLLLLNLADGVFVLINSVLFNLLGVWILRKCAAGKKPNVTCEVPEEASTHQPHEWADVKFLLLLGQVYPKLITYPG